MIQTKPKKCKGTGPAKGFESCGEVRYIKLYGLCAPCLYKWIYSTDEGNAYLRRQIIPKAKKEVVKEKKENDKQKKLESKSIRGLIIDAKVPFQKLIRIRDHRKNCICCDNILPYNLGDYDAGHYFKAEIYSGLIFHPDNCHGQRVYCNQHLHGNEAAYTKGIKKRIGLDKYNELDKLSTILKSYKWDRAKLIELKKFYTHELKLVESGQKNINDVDFSIGIISNPICNTDSHISE